MYQKSTGSYDEIPAGMKRYINNCGCHFNKKLCMAAAEKMYKEENGKMVPIEPYTKEQVDNILRTYNVRLERNKMHDAVYVANMCAADFLGNSIPSEEYLAKYIKDVIDDPDKESGYVFNRFYADCMFMDDPVDWDDML